MKIFELCSFSVFGASSLAASAVGGDAPQWLFQFGALGLCAFMVFQNYNQQNRLTKVIDRKDGEIGTLVDRLEEISSRQAEGLARLAQALEDRPCVAGDQRIGTNNRRQTG